MWTSRQVNNLLLFLKMWRPEFI